MTSASSSKSTTTQRSPQAVSTDAQIELFQQGTKFIKLLRPASVGGGIIRLTSEQKKKAVERFETTEGLDPIKFVPASGAATRMFKRVFSWIENPKQHKKEIDDFFDRAEEFAFFERWWKAADDADVETFQSGLDSKVRWLELLVSSEGLGFASKPKGLLEFHLYESPDTPVVEHLKEAIRYSRVGEVAKVHFTVSPEHRADFEKEVGRQIKQDPFNEIKWEIKFSSQDPATDTIAVDLKNSPIEEGGKLVTRPGGHGALIHNLNAIEEDLIFIKNIDNVAYDRLLDETVEHKKALAGILLELRADLKQLYDALGKGLLDETHINELRDKWKIRIPKDYQKLKAYLERPFRVCGMVKNEGEPGGGPFYTLDKFTGESLQIVEQAQIDPKDSRQQSVLATSTHFNPVDLVCYVRNFEDEPIDLTKYVDDDLFFIAQKSWKGKDIKALEWPGLWNGAMAHWVTLFVEVPIETFNPVKEVSDLLRPAHLPS